MIEDSRCRINKKISIRIRFSDSEHFVCCRLRGDRRNSSKIVGRMVNILACRTYFNSISSSLKQFGLIRSYSGGMPGQDGCASMLYDIVWAEESEGV